MAVEQNIWVMRADGTGITQLTTQVSPNFSEEPCWRPDGNLIIFTSKRGTTFERLYTMKPDGSSQTLFAYDTGNLHNYAGAIYSPDGTRIVFQKDGGDKPKAEIWLMDADGSSEVQLTDGTYEDEHPQWSPDGTKIAFTRIDGSAIEDVWIMDADGANQTRLITSTGTDASEQPSFSPDGERIVLSRYLAGSTDKALWSCDYDGSDLFRITPADTNETNNAHWSAHQSDLAVFSSLRVGDFALFRVSSADSRIRNNYDLVTDRLIDPLVSSWSVGFGAGNDTLSITRAPATAGAPVYGSPVLTISDAAVVGLGSINLNLTNSSIAFAGVAAANTALLTAKVAGDTDTRLVMRCGNLIEAGSGSAATDVALRRSAAGEFAIRDPANSAYKDLRVGKLGINGVAPPAQSADTAAQATTAATNAAPYGFATAAQADAIATHLNDIRTCLRNHGLMA